MSRVAVAASSVVLLFLLHRSKIKSGKKQMAKRGDQGDDNEDHISKLPDDVFIIILSSLGGYKDTVRTASVSRRWRDVVRTQVPNLEFALSRKRPSSHTSMERTLRRRCLSDASHDVASLCLHYRRTNVIECRYAEEFIALANARQLRLVIDYDLYAPRGVGAGAGAWYLELPPATIELDLTLCGYAVRTPLIRGSGVGVLRSLTLTAKSVLSQDFFLTQLPALEELRIEECVITTGICITSDTMPRLRHLEITDVHSSNGATKQPEISVLADELRTLRLSSYWASMTYRCDQPEEAFRATLSTASCFTTYSCFRLRAPRLQVFEWRCGYADEVRIESVGYLRNVVVDLAAGRKPRQANEQLSYVTVGQRDQLMIVILNGLMPGLRPLVHWEDVKRRCVQKDHRWLRFEITE